MIHLQKLQAQYYHLRLFFSELSSAAVCSFSLSSTLFDNSVISSLILLSIICSDLIVSDGAVGSLLDKESFLFEKSDLEGKFCGEDLSGDGLRVAATCAANCAATTLC